MLCENNEDGTESERLAAQSGTSRLAAHRTHHWRQAGLAARRASPTSIDLALTRLTASVAAIRAYLYGLKQLEHWLNDRLRTIDQCLGSLCRHLSV